jgi:hypothetical protein
VGERLKNLLGYLPGVAWGQGAGRAEFAGADRIGTSCYDKQPCLGEEGRSAGKRIRQKGLSKKVLAMESRLGRRDLLAIF